MASRQGGSAGRADDYPRAVLFMLLAALFLPLLNAAVKQLSGHYPVVELLWARYAGHLAFMLVVFAPRHGAALLRSTRPLLQVSRSSLFCISTFGMFYALGFVPLATAVAINFTSPLMVTALAPFALGERVSLPRAVAVAIGFAGAMIVVRPGSGAFHPAAFLIFASAAASAVTQVLSRKVAGHDTPETSNTYMVLAGFVLSTLPLPWLWQTPASVLDALLFVSLGLFGGLGHYCLVRAFELAPAPFVSPLNYVQILGAALLGYAIFGQAPDLWTAVGGLVIASSGIFIVTCERWRARGR